MPRPKGSKNKPKPAENVSLDTVIAEESGRIQVKVSGCGIELEEVSVCLDDTLHPQDTAVASAREKGMCFLTQCVQVQRKPQKGQRLEAPAAARDGLDVIRRYITAACKRGKVFHCQF